jgi:glyceraldehyde 3-phosphate dehydrogenase
VIGCSQSLLFDTQATQRAGRRLLKTLGWYETLGHASRVLEVAAVYAGLDNGDRA